MMEKVRSSAMGHRPPESSGKRNVGHDTTSHPLAREARAGRQLGREVYWRKASAAI
jgi:hypothetical protein